MGEPNEVGLMREVSGGDEQAFDGLVRRYKNPLVNYLTHLSGSKDRAEDYAQEAFVRLYEHAQRYEDRDAVAPLLYRIATNLVRTDLRRAVRWRNLLPLFHSNGHSNGTSPHRRVLEDEVKGKVAEALESLPLNFRAPLLLYEMEDWSYQQIAQSLGCSEGTIKSRICRAREKLRQRLAPYWNGGLPHE